MLNLLYVEEKNYYYIFKPIRGANYSRGSA